MKVRKTNKRACACACARACVPAHVHVRVRLRSSAFLCVLSLSLTSPLTGVALGRVRTATASGTLPQLLKEAGVSASTMDDVIVPDTLPAESKEEAASAASSSSTSSSTSSSSSSSVLAPVDVYVKPLPSHMPSDIIQDWQATVQCPGTQTA